MWFHAEKLLKTLKFLGPHDLWTTPYPQSLDLTQPFTHRLVPNPNFSCRHFWRLLLKSDLDLIDVRESCKRLTLSHYKIFRMKIVKTFTSCGKAGCWVLSCDWHRGNHHLSIQPSSSSSSPSFFLVCPSEKSQVDLIPLLSYGLCVPVCLLAVFIVERKGLRTGSIEHH